jgi:hypothetical protein
MMEAILQDCIAKLSRSNMNLIGHHIAWLDHCIKVSVGISSSIVSFNPLLYYFSAMYIIPHMRSSSIPNQEFQAELTKCTF